MKLGEERERGIPVINIDTPSGAYEGARALTVQSFRESNSKLGLEWEASRRIESVSEGDKLYSVLVVGDNYPIDLKSRVIGATGSGIIGRIYELQPSDIATLGVADPFYNMRFDLADFSLSQPEAKVYPESQVTFTGGVTAESFAIEANKRGADIHLETDDRNNNKGSTAESLGSDRILYQSKIALLEIESLDGQNINARIEIFEGELDLPVEES